MWALSLLCPTAGKSLKNALLFGREFSFQIFDRTHCFLSDEYLNISSIFQQLTQLKLVGLHVNSHHVKGIPVRTKQQ